MVSRAQSQAEIAIAEEIKKQFLAKNISLNPLCKGCDFSTLKDGYYLGYQVYGDVVITKQHLEEYIEYLTKKYSSFNTKEQIEMRNENKTRINHKTPKHLIDISIFKKEHDNIIRVNIEVNREYSYHDECNFIDYFKEHYENAITIWQHNFLRDRREYYRNGIMEEIFKAFHII